MEQNEIFTSGYIHIEPNSHFFTNIDQIISYIKLLDENISDYSLQDLLIGLENTKKNNFDLKKPQITELENQIELLEKLPYETMYSGSLGDIKHYSVIKLKHINKKINEIRNQLIKESKNDI